MKILFDLFPVILFFISYRIVGDIFIATPIAMLASFMQLVFAWIYYRKIEKPMWISFILIIALGSATLFFRNPLFIYWKPTVFYWIIALLIILFKVFSNTNLTQKLMHRHLNLSPSLWNRLNFAWATFFITIGALNLLVAFNYPESFWVNFKLFGMTGLTFIFLILQMALLAKYINNKE